MGHSAFFLLHLLAGERYQIGPAVFAVKRWYIRAVGLAAGMKQMGNAAGTYYFMILCLQF